MAVKKQKKKGGARRSKAGAGKFRKAKWGLIAGLVVLGLFYLLQTRSDSFSSGEYLYIRSGSAYEQVEEALLEQGFIHNAERFRKRAGQSGYAQHVLPGKYRIRKGMREREILDMLQSGRQEAVQFVVKKLRTRDELIRLVGTQLEADTLVLRQLLSDSIYLARYALNAHTAMCAVMPGTYTFFWNSDAETVFKKIARQYVAFWTKERKAKASKMGLNPQEAIVLASIVEEESNKSTDKPKIASVYLNRIRAGMKLQADPTAKFAYGDFMIRRIKGEHIAVNSPYNTYKVAGLPPGPICTPSRNSIEAVLNAPKTNYIYFCAREDFSGYHNFAATWQQHNANARKYHAALKKRGIR
ncbi:MAG: endolytic transglycosylase MltG [Chitinophagaceae bacterium]|nr:endolytic transglycosylase MltG [Chitinophagaceae bacterium]